MGVQDICNLSLSDLVLIYSGTGCRWRLVRRALGLLRRSCMLVSCWRWTCWSKCCSIRATPGHMCDRRYDPLATSTCLLCSSLQSVCLRIAFKCHFGVIYLWLKAQVCLLFHSYSNKTSPFVSCFSVVLCRTVSVCNDPILYFSCINSFEAL